MTEKRPHPSRVGAFFAVSATASSAEPKTGPSGVLLSMGGDVPQEGRPAARNFFVDKIAALW